MKTEPKDLAYPLGDSGIEKMNHGHFQGFNSSTNPLGLTKREYFAAMAMQGILSSPDAIASISEYQRIAKMSIHQADALIDTLNE